MKYIVALLFFSLTLSTFSIKALAIAAAIVGMISLFNLRDLVQVRFRFIYILIAILLNSLILVSSFPDALYYNAYFKYLFYVYTLFLFFYLIDHAILSVSEMIASVKIYILMHSFFLIIQLFYYIYFSEFLNFDEYIREQDSVVLYETKALEDFFITIRVTGVFSEPSFYAISVLPLSFLVFMYEKNWSLPIVIGFATSFITFSVAALFVGFIYLIVVFFVARNKISLVLIYSTLFLISLPYVSNFIDLRLFSSIDYEAIYSRSLIFDEFDSRGILRNIYGSGFFWNENFPIGVTNMKGFHTRDSSFYVYIFFTSGAFGLFILLSFVAYIFFRSKAYGVGLIASLFFKYHILSGSFYVLLMVLFSLVFFSKSRVFDYN